MSRALNLLNGLTLPSLDESAGPAKSLKVTADAKTKTLLDAYEAQKMETEVCHTLFAVSGLTKSLRRIRTQLQNLKNALILS